MRKGNPVQFRKGILYQTGLVIIASFLVAGLVSLAYTSWSYQTRYEALASQRFQQLIDTVTSSANIACFANDLVLAQDVAKGLLSNSEVLGVTLTCSGQVLAEQLNTGNHVGDRGPPEIRTLYSPFNPREIVGEIRLIPNQSVIDERIVKNILVSSLSFWVQLALIGIVVSITLVLRLVRPVKSISDQLHHLRAENGEQLKIPHGHEGSELGRLVEDINHLSSKLVGSLQTERTIRHQHVIEERKYRAIFDHAETGLFMLERGGRLQSWNRAFADLTGIPLQALTQAPPGLRDLALEDPEQVQRLALEALDQQVMTTADLHVQRDGHSRWVRITLNPVDIDLLQGVLIDITHERQLVQEHEQARLVAEEVSRAKSMFLANMSHEIRTPLNAINGLVQLLKRSGHTAEQGERLDRIELAGGHLLEVINAILDMSKIESGKFTLEETDVDVLGILTKVHAILSQTARDKGLELRIEASALPLHLLGDPTRLRQALINYANNAIKFTDRGHVTLRARLAQEDETRVLVRFEVEDTGIGIAGEELERIFNVFEQSDNTSTRQHGGTGLGLAITRHFAQLMGGESGAESTPGSGSRFWFTARLKKGSGTRDPSARGRAESAEDILRRRYTDRRILVVDDEIINRDITLALLGDVFPLLDSAEDGQEAVEMVEASPYDLILMDMQMPRLDGVEATRILRTLPKGQHVPIVAMTANAFAEDKARCFDAGMDDFLTKPVDVTDLFERVLRRLELGRRAP